MPRPFYAYILHCADGSYYVGHTDNLVRRYNEHCDGRLCGYTAVRRPVQLVWSQEFVTRQRAKDAEGRIKKWSRAKKQALIRGNIEALRSAARKNWISYRAGKQCPASPE